MKVASYSVQRTFEYEITTWIARGAPERLHVLQFPSGNEIPDKIAVVTISARVILESGIFAKQELLGL
jgi:hypothetical protein